MARTSVSDEEIQLRKRARRRLVGAIALVIIVVAAVPLLLDGAPKPANPDMKVQMPVPGVQPADGEPAPPVAADAAATPEQQAAADSAPPAGDANPSVPPVDAPPPVAVPAAPEPQMPAAVEQHAKAAPEAYAVPIIATVSPAKARELRQKLAKAKFAVYLEKTPDGGKTRVRVGPFKQKEAAERARERLVKLGFDPGKVVPKGE